MTMLRIMQGWSAILWFCLIIGTYFGIRDKTFLPTFVGAVVNLMFQYSTVKGIRQRKSRLTQTEG